MSAHSVKTVVVNWNQPYPTIKCVRSIEKSENVDVTAIVVDNGSDDDSVKVIRENCPHALMLESKRNLGFAGGCNMGIRKALALGCDFILLLNNDAVVAPNTVTLLADHLETHSDAGICGAMILYKDQPESIQIVGGFIDLKTGLPRIVGAGEKDAGRYEATLEFDMVSGCALMAKREIFERVGLFDEKYFCYFEEADLCFRARRSGYKVMAVPQAKVYHELALSSGGAASLPRIYYSVRNHLLFLNKNGYMRSRLLRWLRNIIVVTHYVGFVLFSSEAPKIGGVRACVLGCYDYMRGRFGPIEASSSQIRKDSIESN